MTTRPIPAETASELSPREKELAMQRTRRRLILANLSTFVCASSFATYLFFEGAPSLIWGVTLLCAASTLTDFIYFLTRSGALAALAPGESLDEEDFPG